MRPGTLNPIYDLPFELRQTYSNDLFQIKIEILFILILNWNIVYKLLPSIIHASEYLLNSKIIVVFSIIVVFWELLACTKCLSIYLGQLLSSLGKLSNDVQYSWQVLY